MKKDLASILRAQGYAPRSLLDVGAHVGSFAQEFVAAFPECVPTLVEPNPHCREALGHTGFETHLVAASDQNGEGELFLTKEWLQSTGCSLYRENTQFFRDDVVMRQKIQKARIDDLFAGRRFDFVKIDTQGAELDVLRGGANVLRQAHYILVEISLVNYNEGGATAEDVFEQLDQLGFHCTDVTEFHRLANVQNGGLLQVDVLFEPRRASKPTHLRAVEAKAEAGDPERLCQVARQLTVEGKSGDALALLQHLHATHATNVSVLRQLIGALNSEGKVLEAVEKLIVLKRVLPQAADVVADIQAQLPAAIERFNACLASGDIAGAEAYASGFATLAPGNIALVNSAMTCNDALGRTERALGFANTILMIDPDHAAAKALVDRYSTLRVVKGSGELAEKVQSLTGPLNGQHPLVRLRDIHDAAGEVLCAPLTDVGIERVRLLLKAASDMQFEVPAGTDLAGWVKHYRLALDALDLSMVLAETPKSLEDDDLAFAGSAGKPMDWQGVQAHATSLGAETVFFAAADATYVDLYARWYIKSILKHCDVSCLVIVHVIGGAKSLKKIASSLGISDKRLVLCGDRFDAGAVTTKCFDTPPKGLIERPVAHFQSVRFLRLGTLLKKLKLPVFVSDIDLLLQRGVSDLLTRCQNADIVFNENTGNTNPGSRLTANLMLARPTKHADVMLRFLRAYLTKTLNGVEVSRWIDQFGLTMARHHLQLHARDARIEYFDTSSDINNVMYRSFEKNPFRFLSLYHGFDTSTLEADVDEGSGSKAAGGRRAKKRAG